MFVYHSFAQVHHIHVVLAFLPGLDQMPGLRFLFSIHHRRGYGEVNSGVHPFAQVGSCWIPSCRLTLDEPKTIKKALGGR